jgi:hypothetical protein
VTPWLLHAAEGIVEGWAVCSQVVCAVEAFVGEQLDSVVFVLCLGPSDQDRQLTLVRKF